jgi:signal transduction histidine kinase
MPSAESLANRQRSSSLQLFRRVADQIADAQDFDATVRKLVEHIALEFGAAECHLSLIEDSGINYVVSHGVVRPLPDHSLDELKEGLSGWAIAHLATAHTLDTVADPRNRGLALRRAVEVGARSCVVVPMVRRSRAIGTITLLAPPGKLAPTETEIELLEMIASLAAAAITNARLREAERGARLLAESQQIEIRVLAEERNHTIAVIAHELRNAITLNNGAVEMIAEMDSEVIPSDLRQLIDLARSSAHDAVTIVARLLKPDEEVREEAEILDLAALAAGTAQATGIPFTGLPAGLMARCRPIHIRQIMRNLIENARRHGGQSIGIEADIVGGMIELRVTDDGPGVSPEVEYTLFEPYVTTGNTAGPNPSTGLGLAISRQLARQMGGDLTHSRRVGLTCFTLSTPRIPMDPADDQGASSSTVQSEGSPVRSQDPSVVIKSTSSASATAG